MTTTSSHSPRDLSALFLDFDGTLVDIASTPEAVEVSPDLPDILTRMRDRLGGALAIVTGRPIAGIDHFLPGLSLDACGLHGLERRVGGRIAVPDDLPDLRPVVAGLRARLAPWAGVVIEDKRVAVAVHWRTAPDAEAEVCRAMDDLAAELGPTFKVQDGKAVRELLPARAGKGEGIRALMAVPPYSGRRPVFVGDDRTDEHGFAAVNEMGGVSVKIGAGATVAPYRLGSPNEFRTIMMRWLDSSLDPAILPSA